MSATDGNGDLLGRDDLEVPVGGVARGTVRPPSSKSVSHRVLNLCLLAGRSARVRRLLAAEDLDLFRAALRECGWTVEGTTDGSLLLEPGSPTEDPVPIFCGNAGTMFRFMVATASALPGRYLIDGTPRLRERPVGPLVRALGELGSRIEPQGVEDHAPLLVHGASLQGGRCTLDAGASSQYLSALLMACSFLDRSTEIEVEALVSTPYVDLTLAVMERFGLRPPERRGASWRVEPDPFTAPTEALDLTVEGDYSAAAYPAAAAMITGGEVRLLGLDPDSVQGDRRFLEVLSQAGGEHRWEAEALVCSGTPQRALDVDLGDMPDQVPTLAAVAAFCPGVTRIRNVAHLRIKESDRLAAVAAEWARLGVPIRETRDGLEIEGRPEWRDTPPTFGRCRVETYDDHRIAMSAALVGLRRPATILDPGVVAKSYPGFWDHLFHLVSPEEPKVI